MRIDGGFKYIEERARCIADSQISARGSKGNDMKNSNADA
jgi:hypothetical protein